LPAFACSSREYFQQQKGEEQAKKKKKSKVKITNYKPCKTKQKIKTKHKTNAKHKPIKKIIKI
jgi:hypothetical protein